MPVNVTKKAVTVSGSTAVISSPELTAALVQKNKVAVDLLKKVHGIKLSDIGIDSKGRVVVDNQQFATKLKSRFTGGAAAGNGICGAGCGKQLGPGKNQ